MPNKLFDSRLWEHCVQRDKTGESSVPPWHPLGKQVRNNGLHGRTNASLVNKMRQRVLEQDVMLGCLTTQQCSRQSTPSCWRLCLRVANFCTSHHKQHEVPQSHLQTSLFGAFSLPLVPRSSATLPEAEPDHHRGDGWEDDRLEGLQGLLWGVPEGAIGANCRLLHETRQLPHGDQEIHASREQATGQPGWVEKKLKRLSRLPF